MSRSIHHFCLESYEDMTLGIQAKEFNICFITAENSVNKLKQMRSNVLQITFLSEFAEIWNILI